MFNRQILYAIKVYDHRHQKTMSSKRHNLPHQILMWIGKLLNLYAGKRGAQEERQF
jgi:hypothetical protein